MEGGREGGGGRMRAHHVCVGHRPETGDVDVGPHLRHALCRHQRQKEKGFGLASETSTAGHFLKQQDETNVAHSDGSRIFFICIV